MMRKAFAIISAILLASVILAATVPKACAADVPLDADVYTHLTEQCEKRDVPVSLILAIIQTESDFDAEQISEDGHDYGLMQIRDINFAWLESDFEREMDFLDPYDNLDAGIYIFAGYYHEYELHRALAAYNGGESYARRLWRNGYESTAYSRLVVERMAAYDTNA